MSRTRLLIVVALLASTARADVDELRNKRATVTGHECKGGRLSELRILVLPEAEPSVITVQISPQVCMHTTHAPHDETQTQGSARRESAAPGPSQEEGGTPTA